MKSLFVIVIVFNVVYGNEHPAVIEYLKPLVRHTFQCENIKEVLVERYRKYGYDIKSAQCFPVVRSNFIDRGHRR